MQPKSWVLIGNGSLLAGCGDLLLEHGHKIAAIVSNEPANQRWASSHDFRVEPSDTNLVELLTELEFDHLASVAHLSMIPREALRLVPGLAINFHDGPLPERAGLNVTSWAILGGEHIHGVTWHVMTERADGGQILEERRFNIAPDATAFLLNAKCYVEGLESFRDLLDRGLDGDISGRAQDLTGRRYFGRWERPQWFSTIRWESPAEEIAALVRALDFGPQPNPLAVAKVLLEERLVAVRHVNLLTSTSGYPAGTILEATSHSLRVTTGTSDVELTGFIALDGTPLDLSTLATTPLATPGARLESLYPDQAERLTQLESQAVRSEAVWREILRTLTFPDLDLASDSTRVRTATNVTSLTTIDRVCAGVDRISGLLAAIAVLASRRSGASVLDFAYTDIRLSSRVQNTFGAFADTVPFRVDVNRFGTFANTAEAIATVRSDLLSRGPLARDLAVRQPELRSSIQALSAATISVGIGVAPPPAAVRFWIAADGSQCDLVEGPEELVSQLNALIGNVEAEPNLAIREIELMTPLDLEMLESWNDTACQVPPQCIHEQFVTWASQTPSATALVFRGRTLSYQELDERTNRLARHLRALGVGPDVLVGIYLPRSVAMVEAVIATLKAGGAYVPLDPTYPADRLEFMLADSSLSLVLTDDTLGPRLPLGLSRVVSLDADQASIDLLPATPLDAKAAPSDLAYVIYTSGSTGRPKGVMVEHRNIANFGVGMDETIDTTPAPNTWLAVTSLSFDISVLELLWTLARGFTVVLHRDDERESFVTVPQRKALDFSLFYFSSDENEHQQDKYRLLLEGGRFADQNDFVAVWTPERHFHAFGGLFPNPAVTSAAVAAITTKVGIRAGSVVSPLHSALRIAEEWSIVDNLSNGRAAISFAPGWQPNDFVLQPDVFKKRKELMFEQIEQVRRLWRGESLPFVNGTGETVNTRILPRPVQKELPVWVTIAGNPESFVAAARAGANVLTHLLGQSLKEVAEKIALYRRTWRETGQKGDGVVTMMLHTFVGESDESVKEIVRAPMKMYLKSAVGLIRDAAWSFPTIKQKTINAQGDFDADSLSPEEWDALLDHAFERYYQTSGLFGSVDTVSRFADSVRDIGVDEIACLIDFGVPTEDVVAHLPHLGAVARAFRPTAKKAPETDSSTPETIPSLIVKHGATHFQCTPTMAQILLQDDAARPALAGLRQMLVGGEALPNHLARELAATVGGVVTNVYGPTETTVWSSSSHLSRDGAEVSIGFPIANTTLHVIDKDGRRAPIGMSGELHIGGDGVVRGYWKRPELTADRFIPNPFGEGRLYRTGDLVRRRQDGALEFLGRLDHQVKIRGHRIELGEIESRLAEHVDVKEAVVVARNNGSGTDLVAYVIARNGAFDEGALRTHLRTRLPEYMMPRAFVGLNAFPMTPNRKLDRKALPAPHRTAAVVPAAKPENGIEQTIATVWCEVLELAEVGTDVNFADVGGHSLAMVQVLARLKDRVSHSLTLIDLFRYTTIRSLAAFLSSAPPADTTLQGSAQRAASRRAAVSRSRVRARS